MLLALKLLVVLGVLSYALAAVLGERELVVYGSTTATSAAAATAAFQQPLSHFVRASRHSVASSSSGQGASGGHGLGPGQGHGGQQDGELLFLGRRVSLSFYFWIWGDDWCNAH